MPKLDTYHIEVTDTFGGEPNYCWKREYRVRASSHLGAIRILARHDGGGWRREWDGGDTVRFNLSGACICAFVSYVDSGESIFDDVPFIN